MHPAIKAGNTAVITGAGLLSPIFVHYIARSHMHG